MEENKGIELVNDGGNAVSYRERKRIERYQKIAYAMIIIVAVVTAFIIYWTRSFNTYEELTSTPSSEGTGVQFAVYGDGYLKYSKDGISYLDQKEKIIWTEAYTMEDPYVSVNGVYAALADLEGNDVHLYNESGKVGDYSMSHPIKNIIVAQQGVFCVVLDGDTANYIRLYDAKGELLAEIKTQMENNGYPLSIAISSDGLKLAASFYRVEGIDSQNVVSFYNFGEGGKGQSGNLVGTFQFDDMLIPKVVFMDDETVCAIGDSKTVIYQMKNKPKKVNEIEYPSEILSVFNDDTYLGYICQNSEEEILSGKKETYQTYLYNKRGRLVRSFDKNELHESVQIINGTIVSYSAGLCVMEKLDGKEIFRQDMGGNILKILPTNKRKEFLFVFGGRSSRIRLKNDMTIESVSTEESEIVE